MARYLVTSHITHDHSGYAPGAVLDLPDDAASVLLELGHIVPEEQAQPVDVSVATEPTEAPAYPESADSGQPPTGGDSETTTSRRTRKPKA